MQTSRQLSPLSKHFLQKSNIRVLARSFTATAFNEQGNMSNLSQLTGKKEILSYFPLH